MTSPTPTPLLARLLGLLLLVGLLLPGRAARAQGVGIGTGGTAPAASAALEIRSATKGLLPPRLTTAQRDAIAGPAAGLLVFNTSTGAYNLFNGTGWQPLLAGAVEGSTFFDLGPGNVGIGTASPTARLDVRGPGGIRGYTTNSGGASDFSDWFHAFGGRAGTAMPRVVLGTNFGTAYLGGHAFDASNNVTGWAELILNAGPARVGVGTAAPTAKLDVQGAGGLRAHTTNTGTAADGSDWYSVLGGAAGTAMPRVVLGTCNGKAQLGGHAFDAGGTATAWADLVLNAGGGNVGIGTANPAVPLDVQRSNSLGSYAFAFYAYNGSVSTGTSNSAPANVSIRASGRVVAAEFNATSDGRLKNVLGRSNRAADLALLTQLRITDYTLRDRAQFGERRFKKVIAQEVEAVFPQAVTQQTGFLPDVYAVAKNAVAEGDSVLRLTLPTAAPVGARAGQRVRLVGPAGELVLAVAQAPAGPVLRLRGAAGQVAALAGGPVFVFGLEHADVRAVDYEALAMLNISATQELARQLAALQTGIGQHRAQAADTGAAVQAFRAEASAATAEVLHWVQALEGQQARAGR